jgi:hypothetical protein
MPIHNFVICRRIMGHREGTNAGRVCKLEAVEGLVVVADDTKVAGGAKQVDDGLLGSVEVLVLIDENVVVELQLGRRRIIPEILINLRDDLADEHADVKPEPLDEHAFKSLIIGIDGVSRLLMLKPRPSGLIGANTLGASSLVAERSRQIVEKGLHFEAVERPGNAAGRCEHILPAENAHAERMQSRASDICAAGNPNLHDLPLEILRRHVGEGYR